MKLELTREEILEKLIRSYEGYFDIERSDDFEPPLQAVCHFNVRSAKYVLLKKAELWSATSNEHVYIFSVPELTEEIYRICEKKAYDEGMKLIDPKPGHMYTYITAIFICDTCTPEAKNAGFTKVFIFRCTAGWISIQSLSSGVNRIFRPTAVVRAMRNL